MQALAESAARRSRTYWLLAQLVLQRPDAASLAGLDIAPTVSVQTGEQFEPLAVEVARLSAAARAGIEDAAMLEALQVDYTRLFAGVVKSHGSPAPFESVVLESRLMGDSTVAVEAAYAEAGFDAPVPEAGPPDHLGAELRFLSLACYREMQAWQAGERAAAAVWVDRERRFLDEHLLAWVPQYCASLAQAAQTAFYRAAASLIGEACLLDREDITLLADRAAS